MILLLLGLGAHFWEPLTWPTIIGSSSEIGPKSGDWWSVSKKPTDRQHQGRIIKPVRRPALSTILGVSPVSSGSPHDHRMTVTAPVIIPWRGDIQPLEAISRASLRSVETLPKSPASQIPLISLWGELWYLTMPGQITGKSQSGFIVRAGARSLFTWSAGLCSAAATGINP